MVEAPGIETTHTFNCMHGSSRNLKTTISSSKIVVKLDVAERRVAWGMFVCMYVYDYSGFVYELAPGCKDYVYL